MDFSSFSQTVRATTPSGISDAELAKLCEQTLVSCKKDLKRVLILPPDHTRYFSAAGRIANLYYHLLCDTAQVDLMPALGSHVAMTPEELSLMFGDIPQDRFLTHDWRRDVERIGVVPGEFVKEVSEGLIDTPIDVEVNRRIVSGEYDLILSVGQVVPHEVVGMANYNKNVFVGCGGAGMINASHMLGAFYGMERIMGKDHSPVRRVFDYASEHFLNAVPLLYVLTVTTQQGASWNLRGVFCGAGRDAFEPAVALSQRENLTLIDRPFERVVVRLDPQEFKSTWLGNKAIYRTRMAIADGGELYILADGVERFGEDREIDRLIRKYGYVGRERILKLVRENEDLAANLSAAAHLIHGSSDGRFSITYCTKRLTRPEVEQAGFSYLPYDEASALFQVPERKDGFYTDVNGKPFYYIDNPALGLWADRAKF